jgi:hypothetical protein
MQNFNLELFSRLFFLNISNSIKIDENFSIIPDQSSPSPSNQSALEPPTPPRTPITPQNQQQQQRNYNNNIDDAKENYEGRPSPLKLQKALKCENESDFEDFNRRSHFNDDSNNFSDEERGGRQSAVSGSMQLNGAEDSEHEESDYASSFDGSRLSIKNVDTLLDKTTMVSL